VVVFISGGLVAWLGLAGMTLALCRVAGAADYAAVRQQASELMRSLQQLEAIRGPSGQPFFATPQEEDRLAKVLTSVKYPALRDELVAA
jgi:hypothetical protein